jgi:hypothetical protein
MEYSRRPIFNFSSLVRVHLFLFHLPNSIQTTLEGRRAVNRYIKKSLSVYYLAVQFTVGIKCINCIAAVLRFGMID